MLQAVLFDLDGTLLHVDTHEFMQEYMKEIAAAAAPVVEPEKFLHALLGSTNMMMQNRGQRQTNAEIFWVDFKQRLGTIIGQLEPIIEDFYAHRFNSLSRVAKPGDKARRAVKQTLDLGCRIVLATNPLFPESAIRDRMNWAKVGDLPWELVTTYEYMHFCKPNPEYYLEIASMLNLKPEQCLMVGNDVQKDIVPAAAAGMRTFLVTDYLIDDARDEHSADGYGDLEDFITWLAGETGNGASIQGAN